MKDHLGQKDADELLERHASIIGYKSKHQIVQAWRAGYIDLMIDGFDELSSRGWTGDLRMVRELRRSTHKVVRDLIRESHPRSGIIIAGRAGYFDRLSELDDSLGIGSRFKHLRLSIFDEIQASTFLRKNGLSELIPSWVPKRPLLLVYLVAKKMLQVTRGISPEGNFQRGKAWFELIRLIAKREASQLEGTDPDTLIRFFAELATIARHSVDGLGRFSPIEIEDLFFRVTGRTPIDDDRNMLLRLPGIGTASDSDANRMFIDRDFADAASAIALTGLIDNPYYSSASLDTFKDIRSPIGDVAEELISAYCESHAITQKFIASIIERLNAAGAHQVAMDIFVSFTLIEANINYGFRFFFSVLRSLDLDFISIKDGSLSIEESEIVDVSMPVNFAYERSLSVKSCIIQNLMGRSSENDLPKGMFEDCIFGGFSDSMERNDAILSADLPEGVKVLLVTLRKLFIQKGNGRKESALYRGLNPRQRTLVPEIINILLTHDFIFERRNST